MTPDRRRLLALFAIAFGLRVLYAATIGTHSDLHDTSVTYDYRVAERLAKGAPWVFSPFTPNAPGYTLLLAAAFRAVGVGLWAGLLLNAVLAGVATILLYRIGERRLGHGVGLVSALWFGTSVQHMYFSSVLLRDVLAATLFLWTVYSLLHPFHRMRAALWSAALYAALVFVEPVYLALFPVIALILAANATHHRVLSIQYAILFVVTVVALNAPWIARNYVVYQEPIPVALEANRYVDPFVRPFSSGAAGRASEHADKTRPGVPFRAREFWRVSRWQGRPADAALGIPAEAAWSLRHNLISGVQMGCLLPFFVLGIGVAVRRRQRSAMALAMATMLYFALRVVYGGGERSRLAAEPLIILLAFYGLREGIFFIRQRGDRDRSSPAAT